MLKKKRNSSNGSSFALKHFCWTLKKNNSAYIIGVLSVAQSGSNFENPWIFFALCVWYNVKTQQEP